MGVFFIPPACTILGMIKPDKITAVIDTREQRPLTLMLKQDTILKSKPGTLYSGDYSVKGLEKHIAIERKSLDDLMGCIGRDRDRFERELLRLRGYEVKGIVVESTWQKIEAGEYRSRVRPSAAIGSLMGWIAMGIPVTMAGDHVRAGIFVARMLYITANRKYEQLKHLS
jgi:DNA excision repair protein ERCC-4